MEGLYSLYTRERTWAAIYCQHINAGYALVPQSATNNSIFVIRAGTPQAAAEKEEQLIKEAKACQAYYSNPTGTPPTFLANAYEMVVLAKSSDYYHYHLGDEDEDVPDFKLVACGLHDSYLPIYTWEMRTNKRYPPRTTSLAINSPSFDKMRYTQYGHNILVAATMDGDAIAMEYVSKLPASTQRRLRREIRLLQTTRYQGRPLAFITEDQRRKHGKNISEGLKRHYARKG
jgi:hypothetical protein